MAKHVLTTKDHRKTRKFELNEEEFERFLMYFEENELLSKEEVAAYEELMRRLDESKVSLHKVASPAIKKV